MTAPKFTPGKWFATRHSHLDHLVARLNPVWSVYADKPAEHDAAADAHIIAAAPDLYSVAANVVSVLERDFRLSGRNDDYSYDELGSSLSSPYFAARSAVAKARGEG